MAVSVPTTALLFSINSRRKPRLRTHRIRPELQPCLLQAKAELVPHRLPRRWRSRTSYSQASLARLAGAFSGD